MILLILITAFFIRLINLNQSLWWDEGISAWVAENMSLQQLLSFMRSDFHPPLHYLLLKAWGSIFGFEEISLRLPSVILGVATIFLTYLIGKNLFSRKVGIIAATLLAFSSLHIYYSQEARMYALAAFAVTLSWYFFISLVNRQKFGGVFYTLSNLLVFYSDYTAVFILPVQAFLLFLFYRDQLQKFLKTVVFSLLFMIPWLPILREQIIYGIISTNDLPGWKSIIGGASLKEAALLPVKILIGRISFENKIVYGLIAGIAGLVDAIVISTVFRALNKKIILLLLWIIFPPVLALIFSLKVPIFSYFRLIFILPGVYLLLAVGLDRLKAPFFKILFIAILLFEAVFSTIYFLNNRFQREDWRSAVGFINQNRNEQTLILHKNVLIPLVYRYYQLTNVNSKSAFKRIPVGSEEDLNDLEVNLQSFRRILLFDYLADINDPKEILETELDRLGLILLNKNDFRGVGFINTYVK